MNDIHLSKTLYVRKYPAILFFLLLFISGSSYAAMPIGPRPSSLPITPNTVQTFMIEKLMGKKAGWLQRIELRLLQRKLSKQEGHGTMTEKQERQAKISLIMGVAGICFIFAGPLIILSVPAAILAIIFGTKSRKGNSNTRGGVGIALGVLVVVLGCIVLITAYALGVFGAF